MLVLFGVVRLFEGRVRSSLLLLLFCCACWCCCRYGVYDCSCLWCYCSHVLGVIVVLGVVVRGRVLVLVMLK